MRTPVRNALYYPSMTALVTFMMSNTTSFAVIALCVAMLLALLAASALSADEYEKNKP